jgi:hypothetical protein
MGKPEAKIQIGRDRQDGRMILKQILKKCGVKLGTGFIWLRL